MDVIGTLVLLVVFLVTLPVMVIGCSVLVIDWTVKRIRRKV